MNAVKVCSGDLESRSQMQCENSAKANPSGLLVVRFADKKRQSQEGFLKAIYSHLVVPDFQIPLFHPVSPTQRKG
jgi:hypothetical protein